jgi:hypothetical protein
MRWLSCGVLAILGAGFLDIPRANACATAPPRGAPVAIAAESAVIVWDEKAKTEHFIRRASFKSESKDFGFLVPTPTKPELAEATDGIFAALEDEIRPDAKVIEERSGIDCTPLVLGTFLRKSATAPQAPVRVLEEKRVAGYDAVVLEADDAGALAEWLKSHGYESKDSLVAWLAPYVEQKWKLTAFKIADPEAAADGGRVHTIGTSPVRMSFTTDRPFFPYREPRDQRESLPPALSTQRSLRVFFIGSQKMRATIGDGTTKFAGKTVHAKPVEKWRLSLLPVPAPEGSWLTTIEDDVSPRPGVDELWFDPAGDASQVRPPPVTVARKSAVPIPADVVLVLGTFVVFVARRVRRHRAQ